MALSLRSAKTEVASVLEGASAAWSPTGRKTVGEVALVQQSGRLHLVGVIHIERVAFCVFAGSPVSGERVAGHICSLGEHRRCFWHSLFHKPEAHLAVGFGDFGDRLAHVGASVHLSGRARLVGELVVAFVWIKVALHVGFACRTTAHQ